MTARTKRKIIRYSVIILAITLLSVSLLSYVLLGPFRSFMWNTPSMIGFFGPRTYLVLLQNNNELRPTGGFITAVAKLHFFLGIPSLDIFDVYQIPDPQPKITAPEPFEYFIGSKDPFFAGWTFRDANFSPDFKKSSQDLISLYQKSYPDENIHGVISVDFAVIESLLKLYGPLEINNTTFSSDGFFAIVERISKDIDTHDVDQLSSRKDILKPFGKALMSAIFLSPSKWSTLVGSVSMMGQKKHLQAYSTSESLESKIENMRLSQSLDSNPKQDYVHVNIANIGGRKADRYLMKSYKYLADFSDPNNPVSRLDLSFDHLGSYNIQSDIYQAYIRSYIPLGAEIIESTGNRLRDSTITDELGHTVIADSIRMKPGDHTELHYTYKLPKTITAADYALFISKQPGTEDVQVQIAIKYPNDTTMVNGASETVPLKIRENLAYWQGQLDHDLSFHVIPEQDKTPPIILWQKFTNDQTVNVRFNELLEKTGAENANNYTIKDLNEKNDITDTISVTSARFDDRDLWLSVSGVSNQPEEKYELTIRDVADISGNMISPNPLTRTLVQRFEP